MKTFGHLGGLMLVGTLLSGCASSQLASEQALEEARLSFQSVKEDPSAARRTQGRDSRRRIAGPC